MNKLIQPPYNNNLREIRLKRGLRQLDVVCILGFTTTDRLSHWEKGQALPNIINLFKLALIFQVPPESLYPEMMQSLHASLSSVQEKYPCNESI